MKMEGYGRRGNPRQIMGEVGPILSYDQIVLYGSKFLKGPMEEWVLLILATNAAQNSPHDQAVDDAVEKGRFDEFPSGVPMRG